MERAVTSKEVTIPTLKSRKVRSDKKFASNAERQRAYRNRKKSLSAYIAQVVAEAEAEEYLESIDDSLEPVQ